MNEAERIRETEANRFAMELLIPVEWIKKDLEDIEFDMADDKQLALAKRYGVSITLMAIRLTSLGLVPCVEKR